MRPVLVCLVLTAAALAAGCDRAAPPGGCPGLKEMKAAARPEWSAGMQAVADGSNAFAFDLYRKLAEKPGNVFFSPFSVHAALAMTADGAKGVTHDEMVKVLHLPADPEAALAAGDVAGTTRPAATATSWPWRTPCGVRRGSRGG